jgi:hypothetical protein
MNAAVIILAYLAPYAAGIPTQEPVPFSVADGPPRYPWNQKTTAVTLRFDGSMPAALEIIRLVRVPDNRVWHVAETLNANTSEANVSLQGSVGAETLLLIRAPGHLGYILDGPFRWPAQAATYPASTLWRRTIRGHSTGSHAPLIWVGKDDWGVSRTTCEWINSTAWECVGVPLNAIGVVVATTSGEVRCSIPNGLVSASGVEATSNHTSAWGRLVVVQTSGSVRSKDGIRVTAQRLQVPRERPLATRLEVVPERQIHVERVADGVAWIWGTGAPADGWVEIGATGAATERIDVREVSEVPPELPLRIQLQPPATVFGRVSAPAGNIAAEAVVTLYRFGPDDRGPNHDKQPPRRITVAEMRADTDGVFHFDDLALEPYEVVAIHPALGRGVRRVTPDGRETDIVLRSTAQVRGRVLRNGVPAAGVRVVIVPDLAQFAAAGDLTEMRGGDGESNEDGRFAVSLAARGSSELRIGDERAGVRRVPLGPAESLSGVIDIGDVELGALAVVTFVLEGNTACDILLTGPAGRTGMSVLRSSRLGPALSQAVVPEPGRWHVTAVCGSRERAVVPASIDVSTSARDITVRLTWSQ